MTRHEADREDLLAEAVALTRRLEGVLTATGEIVVAGFRSTGWLSIYFGPDPMYQVDDQGRLRRAFEQNVLYRTQGTTLAALVRTRTETETTLVRHDLSPADQNAFRDRMTARFADLAHALESDSFQPQRQIPPEDDALRTDIATRLRTAIIADPWLAPAVVRR